jgi:zinc-ribbon domain
MRTGRILVLVGFLFAIIGTIIILYALFSRYSGGAPYWGWVLVGFGFVLVGLILRFSGRAMMWSGRGGGYGGRGGYGGYGGGYGGGGPGGGGYGGGGRGGPNRWGPPRECPNCHRRVGPRAQFCPHCGSRMPEPAPLPSNPPM